MVGSVGFVPTIEQALTLFQVCFDLTNLYRSIYLIRLDARSANVIVLAGEEIVIEIDSDGKWRFEDETRL